MSKRFTGWAILTVVILGLTSVCGIVVNAVIEPRKQANTFRSTVTTTSSGRTDYYRADLQAGPQRFNPPQQSPDADRQQIAGDIEELCRTHRAVSANEFNAFMFTQRFDTKRMSEEWVRFGVYNLRSMQSNLSSLTADESAISRELLALAAQPEAALRPSTVTIESISRSQSGSDAVVLAKHVGKMNGAAETWYTRWWMTKTYGSWKFYDFEMQPSRLRWNAVAAARNWCQRDNQPQATVQSQQALKDLVQRAGTAMETGIVEPIAADHALTKFTFNSPIDAVRVAMTESKPKRPPGDKPAGASLDKNLIESIGRWEETPLAWMLLAKNAINLEQLRNTRLKYGAMPSLDASEATMLVKMKKTGEAKMLLIKALKANPGHPLLLDELFKLAKDDDFASIGQQAATGQQPSNAIRVLFQNHMDSKKEILTVLNAFREISPADPEGCLAWSVIQAAEHNDMKTAAKLFKLALAESKPNQHPDMIQRFYKLYHQRIQGNSEPYDIEKDPDLGPLLNRKK